MPGPDLPLSSHPDFRIRSVDALAENLQTRFSATLSKVAEQHEPFDAKGNRFALPSTILWSCSYSRPLRLRFPEGRLLRVQFQREGVGATRAGREVIAVTENQACVFAGEAEVDFREDYIQLAWRVPIDTLERKLAALTGDPLARPLEFAPAMELSTPQARAMLHILESLLGLIDAGPTVPTVLMQSELESALLVSLLCSASHDYRELLERGTPAAAPWQVRRGESFIEANWDKPFNLEELVAATGASARSLFRTFRQNRGYTPRQFLKQVRLHRARQLLLDPGSALNVTDIALICGFSDLSRFSKDFSKAFGVSPSVLLQRR